MAVNWPATLPQNPASWNETPSSIIVSTEPDSGPSKTRRRFTKAKRQARMSFMLTIEQYEILDAFFHTDLKGGAVAVNFTHPWTRDVKQMYLKEPTYGNEGNLGVSVQFSLEYF